jgi:dihydroflavonol-4-reductase
VLVLGATGAIGAHVVRACLARGWEVRALVRRGSARENLTGLPLEVAEGDLREPRTLALAFAECDAFVHAAGFYPAAGISPAAAVEAGLASVRGVLEAAAHVGVSRGVYVSSATTLAAGGYAGAPATATAGSPSRGRGTVASVSRGAGQHAPGAYRQAKAAMERLALESARSGPPLVVVNPTLCLGEHDRKPTSGRLVLEIAEGRMPFYLEAPVNVVYSGDVGRGIAAALAGGRPGERYLLAGDDTTFGWLVRQIAYEAGARPPRLRAPFLLARAAVPLVDALARARGAQGFASVGLDLLSASRRFDGSAAPELDLPEPTPAVETVRRAVRWFREVGMLKGPRSGPGRGRKSRG